MMIHPRDRYEFERGEWRQICERCQQRRPIDDYLEFEFIDLFVVQRFECRACRHRGSIRETANEDVL